MEQKKSSRLRGFLTCSGFVAVFLVIFTVLSLIYVPKWRDLDAEEMRGLYQEEPNSIDVLMLGSCNMYSSFSPVIAYEQYGLSSYVFACPDQVLTISYHYLLEALKTQDVKTVVLESLFLTCEPTAKREYYNRTALEYMPMSTNKAQLIYALGGEESEYMKTVDSSAPDKLLTYAGYFFPLLRYHGREDITTEDVTFYMERNDYSEYKGGRPLFSYLTNETLNFPYVANGTEVTERTREYFIKIQELCEEKGIDFLLVKSPNHYRWNDKSTKAVQDFAAERGVPLLDFFDYDDFVVSDYSSTTGRLNIYGMKKFTEHLCDYLIENYEIAPAQLSDENRAKWDECVQYLHNTANKKNMTIDEGQIYRVFNEADGIRLLWNRCLDGSNYTVYRAVGKNGVSEKLATVSESTFLDTAVQPGQGYTYHIVPEDGSLQGVPSNEKYYIFVDAPLSAAAENDNGAVRLNWDASQSAQSYQIQRKKHTTLNYSNWDTTKNSSYSNYDCDSCTAYDYRIRAKITEGENTYYSDGAIVSAIPITTPQITSVSSKNGANTFSWKKLSDGSKFEIYRRAENESEFTLYDTISPTKTSYTDKSVENGIQYFYKIALTKTSYELFGRSFDSNIVGVITEA